MTLFSNQPGDEGLPGHERARVMAAVMTTTLMGVFDGTMINIALPSMARAMQVPANVAVWFANGYLLSAAMTLAIFAALAARVGFRPVFSCRACHLYAHLARLRAGENARHADRDAYSAGHRRRGYPEYRPGDPAFRFSGATAWAHSGAARPAYCFQHGDCPCAGGTILDALSWQWLFAINLVPGSIALFLAWRALPRQSDVDRSPFDAPGAALSAVLLGSAIMLADSLQHITQGINPAAAGWGLLTLVSAIAFVWRIRRARSPILPPVMFRNGRFTLAALTSLASFVSQGITFVALPFLFQSVYGFSPVVSALLFTPWPMGIVLIAPHAGRWADTLSAPLISTIGLMIFVGGLVLLATLPENPSVWNICLRSLVCGIGFGCFQSPNNREMLSNVAREYASYASGVLSIVRTFGQCLGAATVGVLLATTGSDHDRAVHLALWIAVIASTGSVLFSLSRLRPAVRASA